MTIITTDRNGQIAKGLRNRALRVLIYALAFLFREKVLSAAKILLPVLPYWKSVGIASILLERFPTTEATKIIYSTGRPRWKRDFVFRLNPYCPLSKLFALTGLYQPSVTAKLLQTRGAGLLVDIGANFGYFAVLWLCKEANEVLAVEPIRENYGLLRANLAEFKDRARTVMCCVGEQPREATMSYDPEYPMLSRIGPNYVSGQRIEMRTLRNILRENGNGIVQVLKCDAEGYDVKILNAARECFLTNQVRLLIFEPVTWQGDSDPALDDLCRFLAESGYRQVPIHGTEDLCYSLVEEHFTGKSNQSS